ncbi:hypothetical protein NLI96_g9985 [Meripilus lineatus]|uniref:Uncharacterized protein n=1 Tax=Meripilus lineatus TaxID=2056292 RepID=A0AAD5UWQ9_9APHY|nr:hypothetical protein NLI96_g9985 [Physisporinus lineatus]
MAPRVDNGLKGWCYIFVYIWIVLNVLDAFWLASYIHASADPNSSILPNSSLHRSFLLDDFLAGIGGLGLGVVNLCCALIYYWWLLSSPSKLAIFGTVLWVLVNALVILPLWLSLIIFPFFGGPIIVPIAKQVAWNHRCDDYPMYAVLEGRSYHDSRSTPNVAHFFQTATKLQLYTYSISDARDSDVWSFGLRRWDAERDQIPDGLYPTLQQVSYNFVENTLSGNCKNSNGSSASPCLVGTFSPDPYVDFSLALFPNIDLGLHQGSQGVAGQLPIPRESKRGHTAPLPANATQLRAINKEWAFKDSAPSLLLKRYDTDAGRYQETVLQTVIAHPSDCTKLKVCLNGVSGGIPMGAEVIAPLGLIMLRQADHAEQCTCTCKELRGYTT